MDSFIQLLNNQARCVAKGCSELINKFVAEVLSQENNKKKFFSPIYLLGIAEVNYFSHHS